MVLLGHTTVVSAAFSPKVIDMTRSKIGSTVKNRLEIQVALAAGLSMLRSADLTLAEIQARGREVAAGQKALRSPKTPVEASPASQSSQKTCRRAMEAAREARATSESFKALCRLSLEWEARTSAQRAPD
jgi:hypothetical protein